MKHFALLVAVLFLTLNTNGQSKNFLDKSYIETTAKVDTLVVPDRIYLSIRITEKDTKDRTSVEELENKMNAKLKSLGIDTKKLLSLSDVTSNFKKYFLRGKEVLKNKTYTLLVYDAVTAGNVMVALEAIDISNVYLTKTEYSKIEALKLHLKQKAIIKAKAQAEAMLLPLDQKLGKAIFISDMTSNISHMYRKTNGIQVKGYANMEDSEAHTPIDIEFEKIKLSSSLNVNFAIE